MDCHKICTQVWCGIKAKMARHIDKWIADVSSTINVLQNGTKPMGFWCNLGRKLANYNWCTKTCIFYPLALNFLLVGPYFQCIVFWPWWPLPPALIIWWLWPFQNFWQLKICLKMVCGHCGSRTLSVHGHWCLVTSLWSLNRASM